MMPPPVLSGAAEPTAVCELPPTADPAAEATAAGVVAVGVAAAEPRKKTLLSMLPIGGGYRKVHAPGSVSHRRKKRLADAPKGVGIKKKRRVKLK